MQKRSELLREESRDPAEVEALERVRTDAFWADFDKEPLASLEFLENRIAPQAADGDLLYIRYVGTDLDAFQQSFDRMQIVDGKPVPPGKRGMLLSKFFYEESLKLKTARRLDLLKEAHESGRLIAQDPQLQRWVSENRTQTREIVFQLDPIKAQQATERLQRVLDSQEADLAKLLSTFLDVNDGNLVTRYEQFYAQLVPLLDLYRIRMGDSLTITSFTRTGYVQNVNVPIYGTYQFNGLEKSPLAGSVNLMDLVSFRELYGYLTADKLAEIAQLQEKSGLTEVKRENAEEALFGEEAPSTLVANATPGLINENEQIQSEATALRKEDLLKRVYSKKELEDGMVLSAAIILKDPSKLESTLAELQQSPEVKDAKLRVVSWQKAVGLIGQFVLLMKMVLWGVIVILFVVVLAIINNAVMMATLQRVREVGTMRAIGAQRTFILSMILLETVVLGLVFGGAGAGLGSGLISYLGRVGIPAVSDELYFFFSGPRLLPFLSPGNFITAFLLVVGVSIFSTLYPAFLATRVSPVTAMQTDE
ncbi:efflux ABC transporter, permease protein [Stigmatella aurantiaca DW4/3-1]|nr:efflux ABC transporter, permease protein [Stigmatella aurantiaca DW4/3-1]